MPESSGSESVKDKIEKAAEADVEERDKDGQTDKGVKERTQKAYNDLLRERRKDLEQARGLREEFARKIYWMIVGWLCGVYAVVVLQGSTSFEVDRWVIITALGGTTATVFGILWVVADHLFPGNEERSMPKPYKSKSFGER